jgi:hypothetical protein
MNAILKYQYDQIIKQLLLLQDHAAMRFCPYSPKGEFCIWKHLLAIEAYADETEPMEDDESRKEKLETLETEARSFRAEEESFLDGSRTESNLWLEDWARKWRKGFEPISLFAAVERGKESRLVAQPADAADYGRAEEKTTAKIS